MHQIKGRRGVLCALAALVVIDGPGAGATPPCPPELEDFHLFQMFKPTPEVLKVAETMGFEPIALITKWRFYDSDAERFSSTKYAQKIWTPEQNPLPGLGTWEKYGIPPGWPIWADLDFEEWGPIFHPEQYDRATVASRVRDYKLLIKWTRILRPEATVCIHGLVRNELTGLSGALIEDIVSLCDAVSPSLYSNFNRELTNVQQQFGIKEERLLACLGLKRDHGVKVLPLVGKRYRLLDENGDPAVDEEGRKILLLTPPSILRDMMELILTTELDGLRVDGVIVWGNDNRILRSNGKANFVIPDTPDQQTADLTDARFLEIITDALELYWDPGPEPADPIAAGPPRHGHRRWAARAHPLWPVGRGP